MNYETREIPFGEDTLLGVRTEDGEIWLAVKKACMDIGLTLNMADRQIKNITNDEILKSNHVKFDVVQNEGKRRVKREVVCLNERVVTLWLAKISLTPAMRRKSPEAYNKLLKYQLDAARVLHEAFYKTDEQKEVLHADLGLIGKIDEVCETVASMQETMKIQSELFTNVVQNMTLTTTQQRKLHRAVKDRVEELLGGTHSLGSKEYARLYFINLWNSIKNEFRCGSRWQDLAPQKLNEAINFVKTWHYTEEV